MSLRHKGLRIFATIRDALTARECVGIGRLVRVAPRAFGDIQPSRQVIVLTTFTSRRCGCGRDLDTSRNVKVLQAEPSPWRRPGRTHGGSFDLSLFFRGPYQGAGRSKTWSIQYEVRKIPSAEVGSPPTWSNLFRR